MSSAGPSLVAAIDQAERLWKQGDLVVAFGAYRQALQESLESGDGRTAADAVALERFADLAVTLGQTDAAAEALSSLADLCAAAGNAYGEDYAVLKAVLATHQGGQLHCALALMYSRTRRFGDIDDIPLGDAAALEKWEPTVRWVETDDDDRAVIFALFYLAASRLAASLGQYGDAVRAARRGSAHAARHTPLARRYRVALMLAEALAAVQSGDLDRGSARLEEVERQVDAGRDPGFTFEFLELTAKLAMLRGDLGLALDRLQRMVELSQQRSAAVQVACLRNLAAFQILLNQTANAERTLEQAAALVPPSDANALEGLSRLRTMAELRARSFADDWFRSVSSMWEHPAGDPDVPPAGVSRTAELAVQPTDFLEWFEQRTVDVLLALGDGRLRLAAQMFDAMNETFAATDSDVVHLRMAYLEALLAYYLGHLERAADVLAVLLPRLERAGLLHDLWQARRLAGWIARRGTPASAAIDAAVAAETSLLEQLSASLDPVARAIFLLNKWTADEEAIASLADAAIFAQDRARSHFAPLRWWRLLLSWRRALAVENRLEAGKRALAEAAVGARSSTSRPLRLLDLWRQPRGEAHVTFSALPDRLVAIVRSRRLARVRILDVSRIALREAVKSWHERMLDPSVAPGKRADALSVALAGVLSDLPACVRELRLRPDDALHGYPFAALRLDGSPIVERYTLTLGHAVPAAPRKTGARAVVLAADQPLGEHPALPHAAEEAALVGRLLSRLGFEASVLTGGSVRKADAAAALAGAAVVHVACHGRFQPDQPSRTGLVLTGPDGAPATLSITEISAIDASGVQLVTLSACWSADNFVVPGRWIFSLPETLCRAGAGSVLASLWEVDDRVAGAFMERFYTNLDRLSRAEALRDAQRACLTNRLRPGVDTSDPIFWAGYYLFGDAGSLQ